MRTELLRSSGAIEGDPAIDAWMKERAGGLGAVAHQWFGVIRKCGDEVRELFARRLSGCMFGRCALRLCQCIHFARQCGVLSRRSAAGSWRLPQGIGRFMRHVKLRPGTATNAAEPSRLMRTQLISCRLPKADSALLRSSLFHYLGRFVSSSSGERRRGSPFAEASDPGGSRNGSTEMRS